jgi:LytS/YehU family sensor histidine kinase
VAPARHKVTISICAIRHADRLRLMIEDDGRQAFGNRPSGSTGLGLANVRQRLAAFYGDDAALEAVATERGFAVTITMPLHLAPAAKAAE